MALTSGPSQPEVFSHQPTGAGSSVSPLTGDFNLTVPITSIPEYPMAIGYNGEAGMSREAGMFGYGINGFSGAIARTVSGLPDDLSGAKRHYYYENQKKFMAAVTGTASFGLAQADELGIGASVSLTAGYNNYEGGFGAIGVGVSAGKELGKWGDSPIVGGVGLQVNSAYGLASSFGISAHNFALAVFGTSEDAKPSVGLYYSAKDEYKAGAKNDITRDRSVGFDISGAIKGLANSNTRSFDYADAGSSSRISNLPAVMATSKSFGVSLTVPITQSVSITGTFAHSNFGNKNEDKEAYGLMYLKDYDRRNRDHLADVGIEEERFMDPEQMKNNPAYLQRDNFIINAQGFSGSMQLFQREYGVVSRNYGRYQERKLDLIGLHSERKEVERWTSASRATVNKNLDIFKLLKKADTEDEKDFDKTIFVENELKSLTTEKHSFNAPAEFKIKGDLAGELKISSGESADYSLNEYELRHLSGTGGKAKYSFLKEEKDTPLYFPEAKNEYQENALLERSTQVSSYTVGEVLAAHSHLRNYNPATDGDVETKNRFIESFFAHKRRTSSAGKAQMHTLTADNTGDFNILHHLSTLRGTEAEKAYMEKLIADIRVKTAEGLTYVYNLPVFNKSSESLQLAGKGVNPPIIKGDGYHSFEKSNGSAKNRGKVQVRDEYHYPYAWLLTAVVGPDYIDFDEVPGPSEGDLGYWVKFKYVRASDDYRWRMPFTGMYHNPGAIQSVQDDAYMASSGEKEIYYVSQIESSDYVSNYIYQKRFDGVEAKGNSIVNGGAHNSLNQSRPFAGDNTGDQFQYAVSRVELYQKHFSANKSETRSLADKKGKLLRATEFKYDYSICPNTPNNLNVNTHSIQIKDVPYHVHKGVAGKENELIETGKLTLRKIQHIAYEGTGEGMKMPSYEFAYGFDEVNYQDAAAANYQPEYNPAFDEQQTDRWGNYSYRSKTHIDNSDGRISNPSSGSSGSLHYYHKYTEVDPLQAKQNAQAFKMTTMHLPEGGTVAVAYEPKSYAYVQNKKPFVMRRVQRSINPDLVLDGKHVLELTMDITDLARDNKNLSEILTPGQKVYGELSFYESNSADFPAREDQTFVSTEEAQLLSLGAVTEPDAEGRVYQSVRLVATKNPGLETPFLTKFNRYLYGESMKMKAIKEKLKGGGAGCDETAKILARYESLEKAGLLDAAKKVVTDTRNYFKSDDSFVSTFKGCFGEVDGFVFSEQSFIRTPVYKGKYTGSRVERLAYYDNFNYATQPDGSAGPAEEPYATNYFFDANGDGSGESEGVATIEPGGGKAAVIDIFDLKSKGAGFYPSPAILSAKTTLETAYAKLTGETGEAVSRPKGKVEYHFFTPKDRELTFDQNYAKSVVKGTPGKGLPSGRFFLLGIMTYKIIKFRLWPTKKKKRIKIPIPVPMRVRWKRTDQYHVQSYAYTDLTNMYGKMKKVVQMNAAGQPVQQDEMSYFAKDELLPLYNGVANAQAFAEAATQGKPGAIEQTWSEAYFTDEAKIELIPWILLMYATTKRDYAYTNMKYTYLPSVLKQVVSTNFKNNTAKTIAYTGFDYYTGKAIETRYEDAEGETKIARVEPAYWRYPRLGPVELQANNLNMLTPAAASYMYLGSTDAANLLGANVVQWGQNELKMATALRTLGKNYLSATEFEYLYEQLSGSDIEKIYHLNGQTRSSLDAATAAKIEEQYLPAARWMLKPYKTYVYETPLTERGTYQDFVPFDYTVQEQPASSGWKSTATSTLYSLNGQPLESKDILDKYVSSRLGYGGAIPVSSVSNATYAGVATADAENSYTRADGSLLLDDTKVSLQDAQLVGNCVPGFMEKQLRYASLADAAHLLNVCVEDNAERNLPLAALDVSYLNSRGEEMQRRLMVQYNANREFTVMTNKGEAFEGFFVIETDEGSCRQYRLAFNPAAFTSFTHDPAQSAAGYTVSLSNGPLDDCDAADKPYTLADADCASEVHTGKGAFSLEAMKQGTRFTLDLGSLPEAERQRKYKALVWVHTGSPLQTSLAVENESGQLLAETSLATPYLQAGNWALLRLEVEPGTATSLRFYVANRAGSGAALYDDYRVLPYHAGMEHRVYDTHTGRVLAVLNNDNLATTYTYDGRGRLLEVKTEVEQMGQQSVKKYLYNEQKKN
jgi:YD repeat-containing protein